jgi:ABC-type multidrug transport system fused ATPase/permease subunit
VLWLCVLVLNLIFFFLFIKKKKKNIFLFAARGSWARGLATMVIVMVICLFLASKQQKYMTQVLSSKDNRMKVTNEAISNMKIIKLQAWHEWFHRKVDAARAKERIWIMRIMYTAAVTIFLLWLSPLAVSVVSFGSCILMQIELTPGRVFTAISTFRILQEPLRSFPQLLTVAAQAVVSLRRLEKYLHSDEVNAEAVEKLSDGADYALSIIDELRQGLVGLVLRYVDG